MSSMTNLKSRALYFLLLLGQLTGALFIILDGLPEFRHLVVHPGEQLPFEPFDNLAAPIMVVMMKSPIGIACDAFRFPLSARIQS